ncbi:hypothetical protein ACH4U3_15090 [Streptomyces griseoruber]|uniref:SbtR family transcriptional regulator n=1 Tax=Streptomyces griseoruber TaxID=1943 RepID=UPI0037A6C474
MAGTRLLTRAQAEGRVRTDVGGTDLFAPGASLAWLSDQPALAPRAGHLFDVVASALPTPGAGPVFPGAEHTAAPASPMG